MSTSKQVTIGGAKLEAEARVKGEVAKVAYLILQ